MAKTKKYSMIVHLHDKEILHINAETVREFATGMYDFRNADGNMVAIIPGASIKYILISDESEDV